MNPLSEQTRLGLLKTQFSILSWMAGAIGHLRSPEDTIHDLLQYCMNTAGISKGFAYMDDHDKGLVLNGCLGFTEQEIRPLNDFWKHSELLRTAIRGEIIFIVPSPHVPTANSKDLLEKIDAKSILICPMISSRGCLGVIILASSEGNLGDEWLAFGRVLGSQLGQAIQLSLTMTALTRSEEKYRRIVETAEEGIWQLDAEDHIVFVNRKLATMLGYTLPEMIGQRVYDVMDMEGRAAAEETLKRKHQGILQPHDFRLRCKDGRELWTLIVTNPIFDKKGRYTGALAMVTDVTERRRAEEQLRQSQKMESIGRLAGGVAHDFNNILTTLTANAEFVINRLSPEDPSLQDMAEIKRSVEQAAALTRQLLTFSRKQATQQQVLSLNQVIGSMGKMMGRLIGEDIQLETQLAPDLGHTKADPGQIEQVLMNLIVNARDAMPQGGQLTLETTSWDQKEAASSESGTLAPGRYVVLSVRDTGTGMSEETCTHIFEPFFTTKGEGKGTGLGLATVYGIVQQNHGHIEVVSELNKGTTFKIFWPLSNEPLQAPLQMRSEPSSLEGSETILLVEDEESIRTLAMRVLTQKGYAVLEARHGKEALEVLKTHSEVDLVITDLVMPEMGGRGLAQNLEKTHPHVKIIYMSGYDEQIVEDKHLWQAGMTLLQKPFTPADLAVIVREMLNTPLKKSA